MARRDFQLLRRLDELGVKEDVQKVFRFDQWELRNTKHFMDPREISELGFEEAILIAKAILES